MQNTMKADVAVLGSGPGGYTAAFRAADLGKTVILIERFDRIGGVCLNVGCIPSKALLHIAKVLDESKEVAAHGVSFGKAKVDSKKVVEWKNGVVNKLTGGLKMLAKQRKVEIVTGVGKFIDATHISVTTSDGEVVVEFDSAIIACGSEAVSLPFIPEDKRIFSSTGALELADIKGSLCVLGGGIIGLEMATVYSAMGVEVTVVEFLDQLVATADADLVRPLQKRMEKKGVKFMLGTKVTEVKANKDSLEVIVEDKKGQKSTLNFAQMLVAVGRRPNGNQIDAGNAGVAVDERGFISVDAQQRTNVSNIYAIGDVVGQPMLAHKAIPEGKVAAEVIAGKKHYFEPKCIPSVAYTDPELAWTGLTEAEAKEQGIDYGKGVFPWAASGRSLSIGRDEGVTKVLFDNKTGQLIGCGIVGPNAGDLIAEATLAIEMGADAEDVALTIHPHPTLSETVAQACEAFEGSITDLYIPPSKRRKE